jgi:hypothetical protein
MTKRLTEIAIKATICPTRLRWPEARASITWGKLHECVDALHAVVKMVDGACIQAEENPELSVEGIRHRRTELGRKALADLENFKAFQNAEKAALNNLEYLESKMVDLPQPPSDVAAVSEAQEIRTYIRQQKYPGEFVLKHLSDRRILGAVLTSHAFLSGLSDLEFNVVRERARTALHPEQTQTQQRLTKALAELREGVAATRRVLLERCELGKHNSVHARPNSNNPVKPAVA